MVSFFFKSETLGMKENDLLEARLARNCPWLRSWVYWLSVFYTSLNLGLLFIPSFRMSAFDIASRLTRWGKYDWWMQVILKESNLHSSLRMWDEVGKLWTVLANGLQHQSQWDANRLNLCLQFVHFMYELKLILPRFSKLPSTLMLVILMSIYYS